jgi:hypothetical protein
MVGEFEVEEGRGSAKWEYINIMYNYNWGSMAKE